jgi:hypothetical protein
MSTTDTLRAAWNGYVFARHGIAPGAGMTAVSEPEAFDALSKATHAVLDVEAAAPTRHTVVGVWFGDRPIVAGVIAGQHDMMDGRTGGDDEPFRGRWATSVETDDPGTAESQAVEDMEATLRDDD